MSYENIIRAWKDEDFRNNLSDSARALLPENPVGMVQLSDADLGSVSGGGSTGGVTWGTKITGCTCPLQ